MCYEKSDKIQGNFNNIFDKIQGYFDIIVRVMLQPRAPSRIKMALYGIEWVNQGESNELTEPRYASAS